MAQSLGGERSGGGNTGANALVPGSFPRDFVGYKQGFACQGRRATRPCRVAPALCIVHPPSPGSGTRLRAGRLDASYVTKAAPPRFHEKVVKFAQVVNFAPPAVICSLCRVNPGLKTEGFPPRFQCLS